MASVEHIDIAPNGKIYVAYDNMVAYYQFANQRYLFKKAQMATGPIKMLAVSNKKVLIYVKDGVVNVKNADLVSEELLSLEHGEEPLKLYTTDKVSLLVSENFYTTIHYGVPFVYNAIKMPNAVTNIETFGKGPNTESVVYFQKPNTEKKTIEIFEYPDPKMDDNIENTFECSAITVSADGTKVAISSKDGTQIMVYGTHSKNCLHTLHKSRTASEIYDLTFSGLNDKLVVSSSSKTIHVFNVGDSMHPTRSVSSFATCTLDNEKTPSKCHLIVDKNNLLQHVVVVTQKAIQVYKYQVGVTLCQKVSEEKLVKPVTPSSSVSQHKKSKDQYKIFEMPSLIEDSDDEFINLGTRANIKKISE